VLLVFTLYAVTLTPVAIVSVGY